MEHSTWQDIRSARVIREDEESIVIDKPVGLSVVGERHELDIQRMAAAAGEVIYPAHRIDKATSGLVLFGKTLAAQGQLTRQFNKRTVEKEYIAITAGGDFPPSGTIDVPLGLGRKNRVRLAVPRDAVRFDADRGDWTVSDADLLAKKAYPSVTDYTKLWSDTECSVLLLKPLTGRRHQLRVHLAWIGHPIYGDPLYPISGRAFPRMYLHAWRLLFAPMGSSLNQRVKVEAPVPADFFVPVNSNSGELLIRQQLTNRRELQNE